ncbi:MAG TPA: type II toxin-antitoxin system prevent-host-death family antitoxin [Candidatus Acidoferrales bacterium]|nr:type II toxin-antitoxin system prevent-host-death family antitoxin [Candidatus Acidoferrales bacterium]
MAKYATVRELKNQTTALIREVEKGRAIVITRRGKPVVTLKPFEPKDKESQYPTTAFDALRKRILAKHPELANETQEQARRKLEKLARKIRRKLPFRTWREMDRFVKGDRYGLGR